MSHRSGRRETWLRIAVAPLALVATLALLGPAGAARALEIAAGAPGFQASADDLSPLCVQVGICTGHESPVAAADGSGAFVVVWDETVRGVVARLYDAAGVPRGDAFALVPESFASRDAAVGMAADGSFTVVFVSVSDAVPREIVGQRFDADGMRRGQGPGDDCAQAPSGLCAPFRVNDLGPAAAPALAMHPDGRFVVVWAGPQNTWARRYDETGVPLDDPEFTVDSGALGAPDHPDVAVQADGSFVVVWERAGPMPGQGAIVGRRFDASGQPLGGEVAIASTRAGRLSVAAAPDGGFAAAWDVEGRAGVLARSFDANGSPKGAALVIDAAGSSPDIAFQPDGACIVAFEGTSANGEPGILARSCEGAGTPADAVQVSDQIAFALERTPAVARGPGGPVVWAWASDLDTTERILGRRFALDDPTRPPIATKISATRGGFAGELGPQDAFGRPAVIGDLDGDGLEDLAVGARGDDDLFAAGAVWILFPRADGSVRREQKISAAEGGFPGPLDEGDFFGASLARLGDFDGDSVPDLVVGAPNDTEPGIAGSGALWVLLLNADGTVKAQQKISGTEGGLSGSILGFGSSVASLADFDRDGVTDVAVGMPALNEVWILFLDADATVKAKRRIGVSLAGVPLGGFTGTLERQDGFGAAVASPGDLDGDGVVDLAVGASGDDDGRDGAGAVWVLFLEDDASVRSHQKISMTEGGLLPALLGRNAAFGSSAASFGGTPRRLAVGASGADNPGGRVAAGAAFLLTLNRDGTVADALSIRNHARGVPIELDAGDRFGSGVALGDFDRNGRAELVVGADGDDDGEDDAGALYVLLVPEPAGALSALAALSAVAALARLGRSRSRCGLTPFRITSRGGRERPRAPPRRRPGAGDRRSRPPS